MKKVLKLKDLAKYVKWKDVKRAIIYHYPSDKNNYEDVFNQILNVKYNEVKKGETLYIEGGLFDVNSEWYKKYCTKYFNDLKVGDEEQCYSISIKKEGKEINYSCSFIRWKYLMNLPVHEDTLDHYNFVDILAHFIWEITFYGPEEKMLEQGKKMNAIIKEVKSDKAKK